MFKVLLNGALDERDDFDLQCCTTVCKVDFINNALAEELLNVVQRGRNFVSRPVAKRDILDLSCSNIEVGWLIL